MRMELELQREKYQNKKGQVDQLSKILEEVIQWSNSKNKMSDSQVINLVKHYETQLDGSN